MTQVRSALAGDPSKCSVDKEGERAEGLVAPACSLLNDKASTQCQTGKLFSVTASGISGLSH